MLVSDLSPETQGWIDNLLAVQSNETFKREAEAAEAIEVLEHALGRLSAKDRMVLTLVHPVVIPSHCRRRWMAKAVSLCSIL